MLLDYLFVASIIFKKEKKEEALERIVYRNPEETNQSVHFNLKICILHLSDSSLSLFPDPFARVRRNEWSEHGLSCSKRERSSIRSKRQTYLLKLR